MSGRAKLNHVLTCSSFYFNVYYFYDGQLLNFRGHLHPLQHLYLCVEHVCKGQVQSLPLGCLCFLNVDPKIQKKIMNILVYFRILNQMILGSCKLLF